ncbi:hypothetical protein BKA67DRAFT_541367 [Truncatella angustata]|uniref:Uncharacterized protein n=1 Tax=Truncatella angustata TaxID=152316 RepID=A0A9P8UCM3_9PEZI|nr:uncharacterized protein BKA67DRAFT_541367 [Truncatella angustata]KAH6646400.1 hypothetical protein BKA67DRAFT_541367 [Truncatella angustata]KAH8200031.1 hypothetical protein TruAng_005807 [Truncatella angustata]
MEYNLDDLDASLSAAATSPIGPGNRAPPNLPALRRGNSTPKVPSTRRGSLVPPGADLGSSGHVKRRQPRLHELNLFHFDLRELVKEVLFTEGDSRVSYHEYAVFTPPDGVGEPHSPSIMASGDEALLMFRNAVQSGHGLDDEGNFTAAPKGKPRLQGRVRQVIAERRVRSGASEPGIHPDGLFLTVDDYESLGLHSGTLPSTQRITVESMFWNARKDTLHLILSFSNHPPPPYDFLSMSYNLRTRVTTSLIRRSFDTRWHDEDALDEYERRLDASRDRWAHPLVLPTVLLQVQLLRCEEAVVANNGEVLELEGRVDDLTGSHRSAAAELRRLHSSKSDSPPFSPLRRLNTIRDLVGDKMGRRNDDHFKPEYPQPLEDDYVPPQTIHLMKEAHDVLKGAIQLLDTLRWMERAVKLLIQAGDELDARLTELNQKSAEKGGSAVANDEENELSYHWHEIRQYLDCTWRLCTSLETDRRMSELRCRAQIDIIYSKMAQEDNNLNARMAVASTRDSSSMKALAVITAIFLPGEFISSLFGISMFDWEWGTASDDGTSQDANPDLPHPVIMPLFWVYWAFTLPLTIFIVVLWRAWWVNQDRFFRRHLSMELSNERYWTTDGKPRDLETSFLQDFFSLFSRSGAGSTSNTTILGPNTRKRTMSIESQGPLPPRRGGTLSASTTLGKEWDGAGNNNPGDEYARATRQRTISFAWQPRVPSPSRAV